MYGDDSGLIWIGTMRFGIMLFDQYPPKFSHVSYDPTGEKGPPDKQILSLSEDDSGNFWLGTSKNAIHWNRKTGEFTPYQGNPKIPASIRKTSLCFKVLSDSNPKRLPSNSHEAHFHNAFFVVPIHLKLENHPILYVNEISFA